MRVRRAVVRVPGLPDFVERRRKVREAGIAQRKVLALEQPVGLRIAVAHDAGFVDDQHAVVHVADDQLVHLLEVREVDSTLERELFARAVVVAEQHPEAGHDEVREALPPSLQQLRGPTARRVRIERDAQQRDAGHRREQERGCAGAPASRSPRAAAAAGCRATRCPSASAAPAPGTTGRRSARPAARASARAASGRRRRRTGSRSRDTRCRPAAAVAACSDRAARARRSRTRPTTSRIPQAIRYRQTSRKIAPPRRRSRSESKARVRRRRSSSASACGATAQALSWQRSVPSTSSASERGR